MTAWRQANSSHNRKAIEDVGYKLVDASAVTASNSRTLSTSRRQLFGHVPVDLLNTATRVNHTATRAHRQNVTTVQEALELQPRLWRSSLAGLFLC